MGRKSQKCQCCCEFVAITLNATPEILSGIGQDWYGREFAAVSGQWVSEADGALSGGKSSAKFMAGSIRLESTWRANPLGLSEVGDPTSYTLFLDGSDVPASSKQGSVSASVAGADEGSLQCALQSRNAPDDMVVPWAAGYEPGTVVHLLFSDPYHRNFYNLNADRRVESTPGEWYGDWILIDIFRDLPESAYDGKPATGGTPLSTFRSRTLDGIPGFMRLTQNPSLWTGSYGRDVYGVSVGNPNFQPPVLEGYDAVFSIRIGSNSRLANQWTTSSAGQSFPLNVCFCDTTNSDEQRSGLATAWVYCPHAVWGVNQVSSGASIEWLSGRNAQAQLNYSNVSVKKLHGHRWKVFRNGEEVLHEYKPSEAACSAATAQEGSYLAVHSVTGEGTEPSANRSPTIINEFHSFVVDRTPPVVWFTVPNDEFVGQQSISGRYMATEPVFENGSEWSPYVQQAANDGSFVQPGLQFTFSVDPPGLDTAGQKTISAPAVNIRDRAGNAANQLPSVQWTVHDVPPHNRRGARARFDRSPTTPVPGVQSVDLVFDRKVKPSTVSADMFRLFVNDLEEDDALTVTPVGDGSLRWRVGVSSLPQSSRKRMLLVFDPAGAVLTDDIVTLDFSKSSHFPAQGKQKTVYRFWDSATSTWMRFYWKTSGQQNVYEPLGDNDPPKDQDDVPYDPEPCILAARMSWLIQDEGGFFSRINTNYDTEGPAIGRVASESSSASPARHVTNEFHADDPFFLPQTIGLYAEERRSSGCFVPSVPPFYTTEPNHSYFGLGTSIYPCPPRKFVDCDSPKTPQIHSSAIRCAEEINAIRVEMLTESGSPIDPEDYVWFNGFFGGPDGNNGDGMEIAQEYGGVAPRNLAQPFAFGLLVANGASFLASSSVAGQKLSQNLWMTARGSGSTKFSVGTSEYTGSAIKSGKVFCDGDAKPWYPVPYSSQPMVIGGWAITGWDRNDKAWELPEPPNPINAPDDFWTYYTPPPLFGDNYEISPGHNRNRIRRLEGGFVSLRGCQVNVLAFRSHRRYPAIGTTTLGELCIAILMRATIRVSAGYRDFDIPATRFEGSVPLCEGGVSKEEAISGYTLFPLGDNTFFFQRPPSYLAYGQAEPVDSITLDKDMCVDLTSVVCLSELNEQRFAQGQEVTIDSSVFSFAWGGGCKWKISRA